jgi:hypothetical protein
MRHDVVGDEFSPVAAMAPEVSVKVASNLEVVAYGIDGRLAERPLEVWAALLGVPAAAGDGSGLGDSWDQSAVGGKLAGILKAVDWADFVEDGHGQELPDPWHGQHTVELGAVLPGRQDLGLEGGDRLGVQIDLRQFLRAVQADQGRRPPAFAVVIRGLLDVVSGGREDTVA